MIKFNFASLCMNNVRFIVVKQRINNYLFVILKIKGVSRSKGYLGQCIVKTRLISVIHIDPH